MRGRFTRERYAEEVERVKACCAPVPARSRISRSSCRRGKHRLERSKSASPRPSSRATVAALTHDGEGVVRDGKTAFVPGALPGESIRFRRTRTVTANTTRRSCWKCSTACARARRPAMCPFRRLRRLCPATSLPRSAARSQTDRVAGQPGTPRQSNTRRRGCHRCADPSGTTGAAPGSARSS